eukprot:scaffold2382_cov108-Isochrysis_galbana.AAC.6
MEMRDRVRALSHRRATNCSRQWPRSNRPPLTRALHNQSTNEDRPHGYRVLVPTVPTLHTLHACCAPIPHLAPERQACPPPKVPKFRPPKFPN